MTTVSFGFKQGTFSPGTVSFGFRLLSVWVTYGLLTGETMVLMETSPKGVAVFESGCEAQIWEAWAEVELDEPGYDVDLLDPVTALKIKGWSYGI